MAVSHTAQAATCTIATDTVVNQAYVTSNSCTAIDITTSVSTTWIGTVDLSGGAVTVKTGATMTMGTGGAIILGNADSFIVETNATATHALSSVNGLQITAANITISGAVNTDSKGCSGANGYGGDGYGPNTGTGVCTVSTSGYGIGGLGGGAGGNGGAYGGAGSTSGYTRGGRSTTYGSSLAPTFLGSSGGTGYYMTAFGGSGGGRIQLTVSGTLTVDGSISADGGAGIYTASWTGGGGGSGGSIYIRANALAGAGTIHANGGGGAVGGTNGGNGGGGRLAVLYNTQGDFVLSNITASKGTGGNGTAGHGTTYILNRTVDDGAGTLTINSGFDFPASGDYTRDIITIGSGVDLSCSAGSATTISATNWLSFSGVTWTCAAAVTNLSLSSTVGISTTSTTFALSGVTGGFSLTAPTWTNTATTFTLANGASSTWDIPSDLTLNSLTYTGGNAGTAAAGGVLSIKNAIALSLVGSTIRSSVSSTQLTTLTVDGSSSINATGKGCAGSLTTTDGYGPNTTSGICAISTSGYGKAGNGGGGGGGGAAHGGMGAGGVGSTAQTTAYGSNSYPLLVGSGGGGGYWQAPAAGGDGGGRVNLIVAGIALINGPIAVNGNPGLYGGTYNGGGGGSGGSIYLRAGALAGSGSVSANGGNGVTGGGGGGGGRIAILVGSDSSTIIPGLSVTGGAAGSGAGGAGTIYVVVYSAPDTSSITSPVSGVYNVDRNPTLTSGSYGNSPGNLSHLSSDWKVTTDIGGSVVVWSATGDAANKTSTQVNIINGTFSGALAGRTSLAASSTYYAFVRHTNSVGTAAWSTGILFSTPYSGPSSTQTLLFDDVSPPSTFSYNSTYTEINASGNGYARLKDLGGATYADVGHSGWGYFKTLTITNPNASVLTNMQVKVPVTYTSAMQATFNDIRFASSDGVTNLPYWLESKTNGSSATFWVKVPSLAASSTTQIRMYYGNADVGSASNGTDTFAYFDDFNDGDYAGWTGTHEGSGVDTLSVTAGKLVIGGTAGFVHMIATGYSASDVVIDAMVTPFDGNGNNQAQAGMTARFTDINNLYTAGFDLWETPDTVVIGKRLGGGWSQIAAVSSANSSNVAYKFTYSLAGTTQKFYVNDVLKLTTTDSSLSGPGMTGFNLDLGSGGSSDTITVDDYRIRAYAASDPAVSFGSEQLAPQFADAVIVPSANNPEYARIHRIQEDLMPGSTGTVYYQFSTDNSSWKFWNGTVWAAASDIVSQANTSETVNAYLPLFASQIGTGTLYTRIIFSSNGLQPTGLNALRIFYTPSNVDPLVPSALFPPALADGSTTSTNTPTFAFNLMDDDRSDTLKYRIQIDDASDFGSPAVDYTSTLAAQGEQTFQVGQPSGSGVYTNGVVDQTLLDGSYYWRVMAIDNADATSEYVVANSGSIAFIVDTGERAIQFGSATASAAESISLVTIPVQLNQVHFLPVTVQYAVTAGSAIGGGVDFTLATGTINLVAGQTTSTIAFEVTDDAVAEPSETFTVSLSSPVNASLGATSSYVYTIIDNDVAGVTITESGGSTQVAESGATDTFTVVLTSQPTSTVQIGFTTSTNGVTLSTTTITFDGTNWNTPQMVTVTAMDDVIAQGTHTGTITPQISTTAYGFDVLSMMPLIATIADNESISILVSATEVTITEGLRAEYTYMLSAAPTNTVQIVLSTEAPLHLDPAVISFDFTNWSVAKIVVLFTDNDHEDMGTRHAQIVAVVSSTTAYRNVSIPTTAVHILEDDLYPASSAGGGGVSSGSVGSVTPISTLILSPKPPVDEPVIMVVSTLPTGLVIPPPTAPTPSSQVVIPILDLTDVRSLAQANAASRDYDLEAKNLARVRTDGKEFNVKISDRDALILTNFISYGMSEKTRLLGEGERRAVIRDMLQTMKTAKLDPTDIERVTRGIIPRSRNLAAEREQLLRVRTTFKTIFGQDPNFKNLKQNLAWNTLMYRIRFPRDLAVEKQGILEFKNLFNRAPQDPFQWATVRVLGYVK